MPDARLKAKNHTLPAEKVEAALVLLRKIAAEYSPATFANSLGAEDVVLTDMILKNKIALEIFLLDTGRLPRKVSLIVVDDSDHVHVAVIGYRPGIVFVVGRRPVFWVERGWSHPGLARGHYKGTPWGPPGQFNDKHDHGAHKRKHKGKH